MKKEKLAEIRTALKNLTEQERAKLVQTTGVVTIEGRPLSEYNNLMIAVQNPHSTIVGGYQQWRKAGRQVMKGQSGMAIWIPSVKAKKDEQPSEETEVNFFTATVFDITQTQEVGKDQENE